MGLRRRRHIAAQVSMGMSTSWCFRASLSLCFLLFFLRFLFIFVFVHCYDHSTRPRPAYCLLCVFVLPPTGINCIISESLHPPFFFFACECFEFFRLPGVVFLRSMRFFIYFRSQRGDDAAVFICRINSLTFRFYHLGHPHILL